MHSIVRAKPYQLRRGLLKGSREAKASISSPGEDIALFRLFSAVCTPAE